MVLSWLRATQACVFLISKIGLRKIQCSKCYNDTTLGSYTVTKCTPLYSVDISVDSIFTFVAGVTRGNEDAGLVQFFIFLFLYSVLVKRISRPGESKIPFRNPSEESLPSDLLRAIVNYWECALYKCRWGIGRLQVHGIFSHRLAHREVLGAQLNYKRSYLC